MVTTAYVDMVSAVSALQARTDSGGAGVTDVNGEEMRLIHDLFAEGVFPADGYAAVPGAGLSVDIGSNSEVDLAIVDGDVAGQGRYVVRVGTIPHNVVLTAADLTFDRIDEIYVVVEDIAYDAGTRTMARLGYRTGDPAATPLPPGEDAAWEAALLIATVAVDTAVTSVVQSDITDERPFVTTTTPSRGVAGVIEMFGGAAAPLGSHLCDGQAISRATNARLFGVIGTAYGIGDGSTTFNVPDFKQRFPLGKADSGPGAALGDEGGAIDHTHTGPSHTHSGPSHTHTMGTHIHTMGTHDHNSGTYVCANHQHTLDDGPNDMNHPGTGSGFFHQSNMLSGADAPDVQGTSGATDPGNTNATDPGDTNAGGTASTGSGGTGASGTGNPPFQTVNFIIWA